MPRRPTRPARQSPLTEPGRQRRERQRQQALAALGRLLHDREQTKFLLGGVSNSTLRRLELSGRLRPIKPTGSPSGKTFYSDQNVREIAGGEGHTEIPAVAAGESCRDLSALMEQDND
jgi:hypothetical protein